MVTIGWAIWFVIFIVDPDKVKHTAQKLINENRQVFEPRDGNTLSKGQYLDKFSKLENILRELAGEYAITENRQTRYRNFQPMGQIIRALYQREVITMKQLRDLSEANKIRNLAAHGEIQRIEVKQATIFDNLANQLKKYMQNNVR